MSDFITERIIKSFNLDSLAKLLDESVSIQYDELKLSDINHIEIDEFDNPIEQAIKLTIKSGNKIPTSVNGTPCKFEEEVSFYLRGMGQRETNTIELKSVLARMLNVKK